MGNYKDFRLAIALMLDWTEVAKSNAYLAHFGEGDEWRMAGSILSVIQLNSRRNEATGALAIWKAYFRQYDFAPLI
jgi:hypothetical protein